MKRARNVRGLQVAVAVFGLVPIGAGGEGAIEGARLTGDIASMSLDSHVRYLSGLLLAIGIAFWASIPRIEHAGRRFRLLTAIVFVGGLARLAGVATVGVPQAPMLFGLCMELVVTPLLCLWQWSIERRAL